MMKKFALALLALGLSGQVLAAETIELHRSENCGCCLRWSAMMQKQGYSVVDHVETDMRSIKEQAKIPQQVRSCHTAQLKGYVFEGHVPVMDMRSLLKAAPKDVIGLAVAGMPKQAPGMGDPAKPAENIDVMAIHQDGSLSLYHHYSD
ncbi:DUF411 domain-containing protein [Celerinatantimonas sp. YJH-8]|uniref:DUF411 domain-containing protein n=1 Tax=Celerinatantimonas sp. YJH-8 TaxID=3228714 RepID=UPI0038CB94F8